MPLEAFFIVSSWIMARTYFRIRTQLGGRDLHDTIDPDLESAAVAMSIFRGVSWGCVAQVSVNLLVAIFGVLAHE